MSIKSLGALATAAALLVVLAVLPALLAPDSSGPTAGCSLATSGPLTVIEATIRQLESGGNYTARAAGSTASGAYQFLDTSWAGFGGYPRAWLAPPPVQNAKAAASITAILAANHNDVTAVPVAWYLGHVPPPGSPQWDTVPGPSAGNRLTPRQYQSKWMAIYESLLAQQAKPTTPVGGDIGSTGIPCQPGQ
jgi:hypothetical protein